VNFTQVPQPRDPGFADLRTVQVEFFEFSQLAQMR